MNREQNFDENLDYDLKQVYISSINSLINFKETWRLLSSLEQALKNLEKINEINLKLKTSTGFEIISDEKKQRFLQILIEFLNNSYEYIKANISKYNLIIQPDELYDISNKLPGIGPNRIVAILQICKKLSGNDRVLLWV